MLDAPGLVGGRYRPERLIAASGMADVYAAHDERLDRPVALKFLRADGPTDTARFRREMTTLAQLEHPGLVRLYDADVHDTVPYLVLELVDGPSLAAHLAAHGSLDPAEADRVLRDVAAALAYVHERGIVHRDVKPSNVLLDLEHGGARLTDFGIARTTDATAMTGTAMTIGTAAYLAPEQARGDEVTSAADVYSLGLVLLECRTGTRAFPGAPVESAVARLTRDPDVPASLEPEWRALLAAMTARDPAQRPTAEALTAGVEPTAPDAAPPTVAMRAPTLATTPIAAAAPPPAVTSTMPMAGAVAVAADAGPERATRPRRRPTSSRVVGAVVLGALLAATLVGLALGRSDDPANDALGAVIAGTSSTSAPTTTAPATVPTSTTAPPATAAPAAVAAAPDCAALAAQRKALDQQTKQARGGPKGDQGEDKGSSRALDQRKQQLDDELKACRGD